MHTLYLGPSWAVQSFESFNGDDDLIKTNLAKELGLSNFTQIADCNTSNLQQLTRAVKFMEENPNLAPFQILFVMAGSLTDGYYYYNLSPEDFAYKFLKSDDPIGIVKNLECIFYEQLSMLNVPVGLIGGHVDVMNFNFPSNITVIHQSWQNFLGSQCGLGNFIGWQGEIANLWLQGRLEYDVYIDTVMPSKQVVFELDRLMSAWTTIGLNGKLWCGVHPNILGNQLFAKEIANSFNQWINNVV